MIKIAKSTGKGKWLNTLLIIFCLFTFRLYRYYLLHWFSNLYLVFVRYLMDIIVIYSLLGLHVSLCLQVSVYFASFQTLEGELFMRPVDLIRVVAPIFPPSESHLVIDGYLTRERKVKNNIKEKQLNYSKRKNMEINCII